VLTADNERTSWTGPENIAADEARPEWGFAADLSVLRTLAAYGRAMSEADYVKELSRRVRERDEATPETLGMADEAVAVFPDSARLWCMRGDLIQLGSEGGHHTLEDARRSYERALELEPSNVEALESLGYFFDAVQPDPLAAESYFLKAIERGASRGAFISLAELYLDSGRASEALAVLQPARCPHHTDSGVVLVRNEAAKALATRDGS
jgi:tetratricopeptide (TPR) repeat protein